MNNNFTNILNGLDDEDYKGDWFELTQNEDINELSKDGETFPALYCAPDMSNMLYYLVKQPSFNPNQVNKYNETVLMKLCEKADDFNTSLIKKLLKMGADYSVVNSKGKTALDYAEQFSRTVNGTDKAATFLREWISKNPITE